VADPHGYYPKLEAGDLLIVAGDLTRTDHYDEYLDFFQWLKAQLYRKKIFISGNHDNVAMSQFDWGDDETDYLWDSGTEFEGLKIYGSPWTPWFHGVHPKCKAFMLSEGKLKAKFAKIPNDTDILITHGPSNGMLDRSAPGRLLGSSSLSAWISAHSQTLKLHVCGHVHESYGFYDPRDICRKVADSKGLQPRNVTVHVNCSHVNEYYHPVNKPIRIIL
jgi:Icc-related predicted phosphoesterase